MKLDLHMFVAQWRRALLFIAAVLAMAAAITLQQSLDKNIFTAKVELRSVLALASRSITTD